MPTTDIFIKTCKHDAEYHQYCLASIEKFCTGFGGPVVVTGEHSKGYLQQQIVKLHADSYAKSDFILITDSDTLFIEPVTPESFMRDGKPMWFMTPGSPELWKTVPWFDVMRDFFGEDPPAEFMRRQPFMFPREVLGGLRDFCRSHHDISIRDYVYRAGRFSEYNILGMYCWMFHREKFAWIDTTIECPPAKVRQFWSHTPISENLAEIERILS